MAMAAAAGVDNLEIIAGPLDFHSQLAGLFRRSVAYCQLSIDESFGLAVVEAMASGCVPIVTNAGALPEITGSMGVVCSSCDEIVRAAEQATMQHLSQEADSEMRRDTFFLAGKALRIRSRMVA
jgi:glycosyltransferase involved in cell wall biosynthesis